MVEGIGLLAEAIAAGWPLEAIFTKGDGPPVPAPPDVPVLTLAAGVLERVATTVTPPSVLAVATRRTVPIEAGRARFVLVAAGVADPGNTGTILRVAEAAGADVVVLTAGSVDAFNPKVVRASAGALFHVPVAVDVSPAELGGWDLPLVGATATGGQPYDGPAVLDPPLALVVGSEAHGLPEGLLVDRCVSIPHLGRAESLNVAMAAAVLCFEVARRLRTGG